MFVDYIEPISSGLRAGESGVYARWRRNVCPITLPAHKGCGRRFHQGVRAKAVGCAPWWQYPYCVILKRFWGNQDCFDGIRFGE